MVRRTEEGYALACMQLHQAMGLAWQCADLMEDAATTKFPYPWQIHHQGVEQWLKPAPRCSRQVTGEEIVVPANWKNVLPVPHALLPMS